MSVTTFTMHLASADCASEAQSLERILQSAPGVRRMEGGYRLVVRHVEGDVKAASWSSHRRPGMP